ncbi:MAG: Fic family protein [Candidatus Nitrohelix vancouverensis]|uniref:Fic family protein n=1 Tax=Candidatus Nitrohelix vancouverensis TaxID=2705534 RepID=A0A7T0C2V0_9BACT|nr:MAG: Fic family protein [Candidatus Nitrohelix vancouverensis]
MEPMLPSPISRELQDLGVELSEKAAHLAGMIHPTTQLSIGELVRSMNCYYSNLIEGHDTHPRDIDRALKGDFSAEPEKRDLQLEAKAHILLQEKIDTQNIEENKTVAFIQWLHREFCEHLPDDLLWVENPDTKEKIPVEPGKFRETDVAVGRHIPPSAENIPDFLKRFTDAYDPDRLGRMDRLVAAAASHHRLLWIHPFIDGNGRVARLYSHAYLKTIGIGSSLWSASRGLARNVENYKTRLDAADAPRQGDLDGRGSLSQKGLEEFCAFFLGVCIDQIDFMESLLKPDELIRRIEIYSEEEVRARRLPKGSFPLLRESLLAGEFERGKAAGLTGYKDRQARTVLKELLEKGLLTSRSVKGPVRLGFPIGIVERWFPSLYP